jgi:nitrate reductase gamma subunit
LLGWIAGELIGTDPAVRGFVANAVGPSVMHDFAVVMGVIGVLLVVGMGWWLRRRHVARGERHLTERA